MGQYLHVVGDFDENDLDHKIYTSLDDFVTDHSEQFTLFAELEQYIQDCHAEDEEPEYCEGSLYKLIKNGDRVGE